MIGRAWEDTIAVVRRSSSIDQWRERTGCSSNWVSVNLSTKLNNKYNTIITDLDKRYNAWHSSEMVSELIQPPRERVELPRDRGQRVSRRATRYNFRTAIQVASSRGFRDRAKSRLRWFHYKWVRNASLCCRGWARVTLSRNRWRPPGRSAKITRTPSRVRE